MERVLLPVVTTAPVPGAFGSSWESRIAVTNAGSVATTISGFVMFPRGCGIAQCANRPVDPDITFFPTFAPLANASPARFLTIDAQQAESVHANLRIQDLSRELMTWGTAIPVVRTSDYFSGPFSMLDIPHNERFRWTLRIYEPNGLTDTQARVRFYSTRTRIQSPIDPILDPLDPEPIGQDRLLLEQLITLRAQTAASEHRHGYADLAGLTVPLLLGTDERLRIEIEPVNEGPLWAFVAVTNNETQHVTIVEPQ